MSKKCFFNYTRRYIMLFCGLSIMAMGIALSIKADIGITPISSLPYVLNHIISNVTIGEFTAAMHISFVLLQIVLLKKEFEVFQLLQLILAVVFGALIDGALLLFTHINPSVYHQQFVVFVLSMFFIAFGIFLEVKAGLLLIAGDGAMKAISTISKIDFGKVKIGFDCSLVLISFVLCIMFTHELTGIREGTVLAAIFVGMILKVFNEKIHFFDKFVEIN